MLGSYKIQLAKQTVEKIGEYQKLEEECCKPKLIECDDRDMVKKIVKFETDQQNTIEKLQKLEKEIVENTARTKFLDSFHTALTQGTLLRAYTRDDLEPYRQPNTNINLWIAEYTSAFMEHDRAKMPHWVGVMENPYILNTGEAGWNKHAVNLLQFKQWDPAGYEQWSSAYAELFLKAVDTERAIQRRPLEQLLAIMDAEFTDEDKAVIRERLEGKSPQNTPLPAGLNGIFHSLSEISPGNGPNFYEQLRNLHYYRSMGFDGGVYAWKDMISALLKEKTEPGATARNYGHGKDKINEELRAIENGRARLANVFASTRSVVQIPQEEKTRSLFTRPIPLIFASTCVVPAFGNGEYNVSGSVPLGKGGVDLIFTDSKESKRTIKALLPENLRSEIKVDLFAKLDGGGIPLQDKSQ